MCTRSARLVDHLTTASISPRSGLKYLETCGVKNGPNEHMYTEAKLALVKREMTVAKSLFNQCGNRYKHTARYLMQLNAYEKLCTEGVVRRVGCSDLHDRLQTILNDTSVQVGIYSDSLQRQGYTAKALDDLNLIDALHVSKMCEMTEFHRAAFLEWCETREPSVLSDLSLRLTGQPVWKLFSGAAGIVDEVRKVLAGQRD